MLIQPQLNHILIAIAKLKTNLILDTYTITTQLYSVVFFYSKGHINQTFLTSTQIVEFYYTKTDTDALLANKVSNTGNASLPGHLDIGTTYTDARIRCNAEVGGYSGYAEINASGSYGMFLNLQTTYPNGGWMYFKINNDDYMQLSGGYNKVSIYNDTTISGNLDGGSGAASKIKVHAANNGYIGYSELPCASSYDVFKSANYTS